MIVDHRTAARGLAKIGQDGVQRQRGKRLYDSVEIEQNLHGVRSRLVMNIFMICYDLLIWSFSFKIRFITL
jgi:hypothetical protein